MRVVWSFTVLCLIALSGCGGGSARTEPGTAISGSGSPGAPDAGSPDAGSPSDAVTPDGGSPVDAGSPDGGSPLDAGAPDGGSPVDAGAPDGGPPPDAGSSPDAGSPDGGSPPDAGPSAAGGGDWPQYRHGITGTSLNPGTFAKSEVANLTPLWTAELGQYVYTQPILSGGVAIFTTAYTGRVVALDAATGQQLWSRDLNLAITTSCDVPQKTGFWASVAVVGDLVYAASPDGHLYALRKSDGSTVWASAIANPTPSGNGEQLVSSPAVSVVLGKVFMGVAASSDKTCGYIPGRIVAVDLASGASSSKTLVEPGQTGAPIWSSISVDEPAGLVYASTGDVFNANGGSEPLAEAIVAFKASDLSVVSHWQNPTPLTDADFGASPTLFAAADGTPLVAAASKDGWLYVLDRRNLAAGPAWRYRLAQSVDPLDPNKVGDPVAGQGSIVSPTFANGTLYAAGGITPAGEPGSVLAFEPGSGATKWKHVTPGYVIAAVAAVGEILVVESSSLDFKKGWIEILDASTGAALRTFDPGSAVFAAPTVGRGLILFANQNGHVTALAVPHYRP